MFFAILDMNVHIKVVIRIKCRYKYCKCGGEVAKEDAVKEGNAYYHKQCLEDKNNKQQIKDLYIKYYNSKEPITLINSTIKKIVEDKGFSSEFVLYALCQCIRQKKTLKGINGLHYIVLNEEIVSSYKKLKSVSDSKKIDFNDIEIVIQKDITYSKRTNKTWDDILFK